MVMAPVSKVRASVPPKVKLPFQVWGLPLVSVWLPLLVLSMVAPLSITKVPVPSAVGLLMSKVPAMRVTPPEEPASAEIVVDLSDERYVLFGNTGFESSILRLGVNYRF